LVFVQNNRLHFLLVNEKLAEVGLEYKGTSEIKHFLYALIDDYGLDKIKEKVVTPLSQFNIAPFYGCHNIRPSELHKEANGGENPYNPQSLDRLIDALEGNPVDYESKNKCCGFHVELQANHTSEKLAGNALLDAMDNSADMMVYDGHALPSLSSQDGYLSGQH